MIGYFDEVIEELINRKQILENDIYMIKQRISASPEGALRIASKSSGYQFYQKVKSYDSKGKYLTKKNQTIISQLAQKDYDLRVLPVLEKQLMSINRIINDYDPQKVNDVYDQLIEPRKQLVTPVYPSDEEFVRQWLSVPYKKLPFRNEDPEYYTENNERVRSKSEIIIANALKSHNVPYRYEFPV